MPSVSDPPNVPVEEPWIVSQDDSGAWSAVINLQGAWVQLGYFGAREDAEETIAACFQPGHAAKAAAGPGVSA